MNNHLSQQSQLPARQTPYLVVWTLLTTQQAWLNRHGGTPKSTATGRSVSSHNDICDFVPQTVEEESVIGGQGDQQVVLKSGSKKPKLEGTLSPWAIANRAILYKMVGERKLVGSAFMYYLSYTTKILPTSPEIQFSLCLTLWLKVTPTPIKHGVYIG